MTTTPSIHLYTHSRNDSNNNDNHDGQEETASLVQVYRDFLTKIGHESVPETNLADEPGTCTIPQQTLVLTPSLTNAFLLVYLDPYTQNCMPNSGNAFPF